MSKTRYNIDLVFANLFFGANFSFYVSLTRNYLDFQQIFMLQVLSAAVFFIPFALFSKQSFRIRWRDAGNILIVTMLIVYGWMYMLLWGSSYTSPIDASIISTLGPAVTLILREPITWLKAGGVFLGCAGALLLILGSRHGTGHTSSVKGDVLCLVSAVSYATYLTAFRNVIVKYSPVTTMKWMFLFAAVVAAAVYYRPLAAVDYAALAPRTWAGIGYVVVCSTFLSYFMVPIGQRYLRPTVVSMYNYVQPVVAVLFSVAIGLDSFGFTKAAAALCVFAGVWLVTKSKSRAQVEAEAGMKKG